MREGWLVFAGLLGHRSSDEVEVGLPHVVGCGRQDVVPDRREGKAVERAFEPVKLNYNLLGNSLPHLHTHVVPRYADDPRPGWPFPFPGDDPPDMPDDILHRYLKALRASLT